MNLPVLTASLRNLRMSWTHEWPGLPVVFAACVHQLQEHGGSHGSPASAALLRSGEAAAVALEQWGASLASQGYEPPYHSRLHTADTLVSLTGLLLKQRELAVASGADGSRLTAHQALVLLVAMMGHDAVHDGRRNSADLQLEPIAAAYMQEIMVEHGVSPCDARRVEQLILSTDPLCVPKQHARARKLPFEGGSLIWQSVLIEEADILASVLPEFHAELTHKLAAEWAVWDRAASDALLTPCGRLHFLTESALFSSPAAVALGLPELVQAGIKALSADIAAPSPACSVQADGAHVQPA